MNTLEHVRLMQITRIKGEFDVYLASLKGNTSREVEEYETMKGLFDEFSYRLERLNS